MNQKKTSRQKRDQKIASLLVLVVIAFGICNIVRWLWDYHDDDDDEEIIIRIAKIVMLMTMITNDEDGRHGGH